MLDVTNRDDTPFVDDDGRVVAAHERRPVPDGPRARAAVDAGRLAFHGEYAETPDDTVEVGWHTSVAAGTVDEVLRRVADNPTVARWALDWEQQRPDGPRTTLVDQLQRIAGRDAPDSPPDDAGVASEGDDDPRQEA